MYRTKVCPVLLALLVVATWPRWAQADDAGSDDLVVAGQAMFRYTQKFDADDSAEIYNLRLYLKRELDGFTFFAEPRFRQTPLRSFSPSNVWIQQAWLGWEPPETHVDKDAVGLYAGLRYTKLGLFWDNSWFGNLPYLNGLKLDPDYGVEASGQPTVVGWGNRALKLEYAAQYFPAADGLNGFFAPDFKLEALGAGPEDAFAIDFDSAPGFSERHVVVGRLIPTLELGAFEAAAGASVLTSSLTGPALTDEGAPNAGRKTVLGMQASVSTLGASIYGERLDEEVTGFGSDRKRTYHLAGIAYTYDREADWIKFAQIRLNGSHVSYASDGLDERLVATGAFVRVHQMLGLTAEYVRWEFEDEAVVDRVEWIIHAYF